MPYESEAQRKWAHTKAGKRALGGQTAVDEWDRESKGKRLPKRASGKALRDRGGRRGV